MAQNLIEAAKSLFTTDVINKASSHFGESESGISKALSGVIPAAFGGLLHKVNSGGAQEVSQLVREHANTAASANLGGLFSGGGSDLLTRGAGLLGGLFGGKSNSVTDMISNYAGVKSSTSNSLLGMVLPLILGLIGRHSSSTEPSAISSLLNSQKDNISAALPSGLNLGSMFSGLSSAGSRVAGETGAAANYATDTVRETGSNRWLMPLLLLLAAAVAIWYFFGKGCNKTDEATPVTADTVITSTPEATPPTATPPAVSSTGRYDSVSNEYIYSLGNNVTIDLPNGAGKLEVGENSTENRLYRFLSDGSSVIDTVKGNWFEFTNVKFKTGSANITDESMTQLKNLVAITKGFPTAQFRIGGYTDNTGDAAANVKLSQRRAEAVASMLKKLGASNSSIEGAKGYGPEWPVADNATPEGRAQNRRVAVNVKSK